MSRLLKALTLMVAVMLCSACTSSRAPRSKSAAQVNGLAFNKKDAAQSEAPPATTTTPVEAKAAAAATGGQLTKDDATPAADTAPAAVPATTTAAPPTTAAEITEPKPGVPLAHPISTPVAKGVIADGDTTFVGNDGPPEAPKVQTTPKDSRPATQNKECAIPYRREHADWFPGLPFPPGEPRSTDFQVKKNPLGLTYTDAGRDHLMDAALARAKRRTPRQQENDRELALHISDVEVYTDISGNGRVQVLFHYDLGRGQNAEVVLEGRMADRTVKSRRGIVLEQTQNGTDGNFAGSLSCMDENGGCQNSVLALQLLSKTGRVGREVQVVHRWGDAHVTIAEEDQFQTAEITNRAHKALAEYFSNTANNSCLLTLAAAKNGSRPMGACALAELQKICGEGRPRYPSARVFSLRTWAIAFGRAGFEFAAQDKEAKGQTAAVNHLVLKGPLVISQQRPMAPDRLQVSEGLGIVRADMVANDGSGDLNMQLIFAGKQKPHMRFNITSLMEPVRQDLQGGGSGDGIAPSEIK